MRMRSILLTGKCKLTSAFNQDGVMGIRFTLLPETVKKIVKIHETTIFTMLEAR